MKKTLLTLLCIVHCALCINLKAQEEVLMTINGEPITKSEFAYIYNKNNNDNAIDKKTLDEYVELFVNFKLKVAEAKAQGLDTTPAFKRELNGYRKQLAKPYLTDSKLEDALFQEAYSHFAQDCEVSNRKIECWRRFWQSSRRSIGRPIGYSQSWLPWLVHCIAIGMAFRKSNVRIAYR